MFTPNELQLIINLCDLALKTDGLAAVNTVVPLASKCQELLKSTPPKEDISTPTDN